MYRTPKTTRPSTSATQTPPSNETLARSKTYVIPVEKEDIKTEAKKQLTTIIENLKSSGNIKRTIREEIEKSAQKLYDIIQKLTKEKTDVPKEGEKSAVEGIAEKLDIMMEKMNKVEKDLNWQGICANTNQKIVVSSLDYLQEKNDVMLNAMKINYHEGMLEENDSTKAKEEEEGEENQQQEEEEYRNIFDEQIEKSNQIQREIIELKEEMKKQPKTETKELTVSQAPKTYAQALKEEEERPKPTLCLLVGTDNPIDTSEEVIAKIKKTINVRDTGLQISKFRKVKDQRVLIGSERKEDIDRIKETLENYKFKVETKENKDPLIILRNVTASNTDEQILQAIEKQNNELLDAIPTEEYRIKFRHRRKARNPTENHIVLQVSPKVWRALTTAGRIYVDFQRVAVFDLSPLVQCSRCLSFGHGKKWCTESVDLCSHCAGPHMRTECPSLLAGEEPTCRNCQQAKCHRTDHNAFDMHCPVRKKWDALARSSVAYN